MSQSDIRILSNDRSLSSNSLTQFIDDNTNNNDNKEGFSPFVTFCFTINYMIGTGFLTIPWAFAQGGLVLSIIVLVFVAILSDGAKGHVLETMARAEIMLDSYLHWKHESCENTKLLLNNFDKQPDNHHCSSEVLIEMNINGDLKNNTRKHLKKFATVTTNKRDYQSFPATEQLKQNINEKHELYTVGERKFEISELTGIYIDQFSTNLYTSFLFMYNYCLLWAYTSVFCSALSSATGGSYLQYAIFFAAIVLPMSCMNLSDQVVIQVLLAILKGIMVLLMLLTCNSCARDTVALNLVGNTETVPMVSFKGISKLLPILCFGVIFHQSIPGLSHPVTEKNKLSGIFRAAIVFSSLVYGLAGVILAYVFGMGIHESCNLNWVYFHAGTGTVVLLENGQHSIVGAAWWARTISVFIVCFPALNVLSGFPLNAITLGDNLLGTIFGKRAHEVQKNRWIVSIFRLIASVPPIILAIFVRQLGTITDYAGTTGFILAFTFPATLYLYSRKKALEHFFLVDTVYSSFGYSSVVFSTFMIVFGIGMFLFTFLDLVFKG